MIWFPTVFSISLFFKFSPRERERERERARERERESTRERERKSRDVGGQGGDRGEGRRDTTKYSLTEFK